MRCAAVRRAPPPLPPAEPEPVRVQHYIERYPYENKLKKAGVVELGWMVEAAQELDADAQGEDPDEAAAFFIRMQAKFREPSRRQATTPAGEVIQAAGEAIDSYFRTHPPSEIEPRADRALLSYWRAKLDGTYSPIPAPVSN